MVTKMPIEKLSGEFIREYTKALVDVKKFFEEHSENMKYQKLYSCKGITAVLNALVEYREELRETGTVDNLIVVKDKKNIDIRKRENEK